MQAVAIAVLVLVPLLTLSTQPVCADQDHGVLLKLGETTPSGRFQRHVLLPSRASLGGAIKYTITWNHESDEHSGHYTGLKEMLCSNARVVHSDETGFNYHLVDADGAVEPYHMPPVSVLSEFVGGMHEQAVGHFVFQETLKKHLLSATPLTERHRTNTQFESVSRSQNAAVKLCNVQGATGYRCVYVLSHTENTLPQGSYPVEECGWEWIGGVKKCIKHGGASYTLKEG